MTPSQFCAWLAAMKTAGLASSDADCAKLLGITPTWIVKLKQRGTSQTIDRACEALYLGTHRVTFPWQAAP